MKNKKNLTVDERGRITLPSTFRKDTDTFSVEQKEDGSLLLFPLKYVSTEDAKIIDNLKASIDEVKKGDIEDFPEEWIS